MGISEGKLRPMAHLGSLERGECRLLAKASVLVAPASGATPGWCCGWVESTGVRHQGRNVPRMLGAVYLRPGMHCNIISQQPSCLWHNHQGGMADTCPVLPAQALQGCLCQTSCSWSSCMCLCASVHINVGPWEPLSMGMCVQRGCTCICTHISCLYMWIV